MVIRDAKKINPEMSYPSCQTVTPGQELKAYTGFLTPRAKILRDQGQEAVDGIRYVVSALPAPPTSLTL